MLGSYFLTHAILFSIQVLKWGASVPLFRRLPSLVRIKLDVVADTETGVRVVSEPLDCRNLPRPCHFWVISVADFQSANQTNQSQLNRTKNVLVMRHRQRVWWAFGRLDCYCDQPLFPYHRHSVSFNYVRTCNWSAYSILAISEWFIRLVFVPHAHLPPASCSMTVI